MPRYTYKRALKLTKQLFLMGFITFDEYFTELIMLYERNNNKEYYK